MNPFEHVKNLHTKKRRWEDFNDEEKKSFNVYIINKTLSFNEFSSGFTVSFSLFKMSLIIKVK